MTVRNLSDASDPTGTGSGTPATPLNPGADDAAIAQETRDWLESLDDVLSISSPERVRELLYALQIRAQKAGIQLPVTSRTPYVNSIPATEEPEYPGDRAIERRIKSIIRWNAMAMVVRANRNEEGIGGHISTYASSATLYEVGYNHFFRGKDHPSGGDMVFFQGHCSPGMYSRAFLEGRLSPEELRNFRREQRAPRGLSSYPHPWLMPDFWEYPTVSLGLGPMQALYRARFQNYLENRGMKEPSDSRVWCFIGDGECDEPETLGSISMAARKKLNKLVFVINCNLQRLDGPVRGNGQIVQELEAVFRGVGWNVVKLVWGREWDPILAQDDGHLVDHLGKVLDGQRQNYRVRGGAFIRKDFWARDEKLKAMVDHLTDDQLEKMRLGGHDPIKVHAAYRAAVDHDDGPTVILAQTVKGYGLGEAGEGKNITHSQKKLNEEELLTFRDRFDIPLTDDQVKELPFYKPDESSEEMQYLVERRQELGGFVPERRKRSFSLGAPEQKIFAEFHEGTGERPVSTTMALVRMLAKLLKDENVGKRIVPIVPDEARTFGMEALFRQVGIYSGVGQLYEPVDSESLMYYRQAVDGQILEEGITEAGSMSSFIAAGTSHTVHGVPMIPMYFYYSMFGFQRIGDLIWLAGDIRARGFMIGATSGRTTLAGEGLQHQDGNSHLLALTMPNLMAYDPAYAYEVAVIMEDGLRRMYQEDEDVFFYLSVGNENYLQPTMPDGAKEGILRGLYKLRGAEGGKGPRIQLMGSGAILNHCVEAAQVLHEKYGVRADVWSATSWKALHEDALDAERWNLRHPGESPKRSYLEQCFEGESGPFVAATDYVRALSDTVARWLPGRMLSLGTDGFGRSDGRSALREFFEVNTNHITYAALWALAEEGQLKPDVVKKAAKELEIDPEKPNPRSS